MSTKQTKSTITQPQITKNIIFPPRQFQLNPKSIMQKQRNSSPQPLSLSPRPLPCRVTQCSHVQTYSSPRSCKSLVKLPCRKYLHNTVLILCGALCVCFLNSTIRGVCWGRGLLDLHQTTFAVQRIRERSGTCPGEGTLRLVNTTVLEVTAKRRFELAVLHFLYIRSRLADSRF